MEISNYGVKVREGDKRKKAYAIFQKYKKEDINKREGFGKRNCKFPGEYTERNA